MPGAFDDAGTLFALGLRFTKLDTDGAPLVGVGNCYITDSLIQISAGLNFTSNKVVEQVNGRGQTCVSYQAPDTLQSASLSPLKVCVADPNIMNFLIGGAVILTPSEIQTLTITGIPTGGTFTITFAGQTTTAIPYNAVATAVGAALIALSNIGPGDVVCTGGPLPGTPVVITFGGAYAGTDVALMTTTSSLTGGTTPAATITTTTPGGSGNAIGWRAPQVNVVPVPNGVAIEAWSNAIIDNSVAATLPYWHYIWPRVRLTMSKSFVLDAATVAAPEFDGTAEQNANFGDGPVGDITIPTDRCWQYVREAVDPTATPGFVTVI